MRRITNIILLSAGVLLSLTGCQKGNEPQNSSDRAVRFGASTAAETRTSFSGDRSDGERERVDWSAGDKIMIWSDFAAVPEGRTPHFAGNPNLAVYGLTNIREDGSKSTANITNDTGNALHYPDGDKECAFWGVYPAGAVTESPVNNAVPFAIAAEQDITLNSNTTDLNSYVPDMQQAYMLAYADGAKESGPAVELLFKPAFTDFEFNITTKLEKDLTIYALEITSETTALSGSFTATCNDGTWGFTVPSDDAKSVKAVLPEGGLTIPQNASDDKKTLSLNVFALPQDLKDLKVTFYTSEGTKAMKLTIPGDKTKMKTFEGCKKHRINGLILPTGWFFNYITMNLKVLEWEAVDVTGDSGEFPQAFQIAVTGDGVKNGYEDCGLGDSDHKDPYRQQWYFMPTYTVGEDAVTTVVTVTFKVTLPAGGTWEVEPVGGTEANPVPDDLSVFSIKNVSPGATNPDQFYGPIGTYGSTEVKFEITYIGTDTAEHSLYFHTYVYSGGNKSGNKYNIDSETQLYDRGRGYHTFIVNSDTYNNE